MNYGLQCVRLLSDAFNRVIMITGNHDCYHRTTRDIHSVAWASHIPNVEVINDIHSEGNVTFYPWLNDNDTKQIKKFKGYYAFAHLELPKFLMNSLVEMPEVGELRAEQFEDYHHVYTGHFHMRQHRGNITYIGNAFPHNFSVMLATTIAE